MLKQTFDFVIIMEYSKLILFGLVLFISFISYLGFRRIAFFEQYQLNGQLIKKGEWYRLLTSGFLHVNPIHLIFNMLVLYTAGISVSDKLSWNSFFILYFFCLISANFLSFLVHIKDENFCLVGASGAVYGVLFSAIVLSPETQIAFFFTTWIFPTWVLAIIFFLFSFLGMLRKQSLIAHEAHWGGSFSGMLITLLFYPEILNLNTQVIIWFGVVFFMGFGVLFYRSGMDSFKIIDEKKIKEKEDEKNIEHKIKIYQKSISKEEELNLLLDKMKKEGYEKLSSIEKQKLLEISENL